LAVIGIFAIVVDDVINDAFDPVANAAAHLANDVLIGRSEAEQFLILQDFLDQIEGSYYYSYKGSLTTPGCNEVVSWIVMDQPIFIAKSQIEALRSLKTEHGSKLVNNFRPIQSLNDRDVRRILRKI